MPAALLGYVETPKFLGEIRLFTGLLGTALPGPPAERVSTELLLLIPSDVAGLAGLGLAWLTWRRLGRASRRPRGRGARLLAGRAGASTPSTRSCWSAPSCAWWSGPAGTWWTGSTTWWPRCNRLLHRLFSLWQGGLLRRYVLALALGAAVLLAVVVML